MTAPQTGFEGTGAWSTLAYEQTFLEQIAAETAATLTQAGASVQGRPIWRVDLGTGTANTMLIVALQHGNEPAAREGVLAQIRDLAYSTDPAVAAYLAAHRIVWIPNVSPDGFVQYGRLNANGVNLNRDFFPLSQPETQAVAQVLADTEPHLIVDCHEHLNEGADWWGYGGGSPTTAPGIAALEAALFDYMVGTLTGEGYVASNYLLTNLPRSGLSTGAGAVHAVGLLSEPRLAPELPRRYEVSCIVLEMAREWHRQNAAACAAAQSASKQRAMTTTEKYPLVTGEYLGRADPVMIDAAAYVLAAGEAVPQLHADVFGIVTDGDTVVTNQHAWAVIPQLLDYQSRDVLAVADRVPHPEPELPRPRTPLAQIRVGVGGASCKVVAIKHRVNGETFGVIVPGT